MMLIYLTKGCLEHLSEWTWMNSKTASLGLAVYLIVGVVIVAMTIMKHQTYNRGWRINIYTLELPCLVAASLVTIQR